MRERERGLRRRRDAGQDPSGTHRNIARDVSPPPEMLYGMRTAFEKPWRFVLGCLSAPKGSMGSPPTLKMLDTALLMESAGGGQAEGYFYTAADGTVQRKAERFLSLKMVEKELLLSSSANNVISKNGKPLGDGNAERQHDQVVAMARTRNGDFLPVSSKALRTAVKAGTMPAEYECLQPFARAKDYDSTGEFANYQHQYTLDDTGGGVSTGTVHRRVAAGLSGKVAVVSIGRRRRTLVLSRNARLNAEIGAAVTSVVLTVERSKRCRVLCLETEFVLDDEDGLWLAGVTACRVAARHVTTSLPAPPPTRQGLAAQGLAAQGLATQGIAAHDRAPNANVASGDAGVEGGAALATEMRSRKREAEEAAGVVSDTEFSQLLRDVGYRSPIKNRSGGGGGGSGSGRQHGRANLRSCGRGAARIRAPERDPNRTSAGGLTHPSRAQLGGGRSRKMATDQSSADSAASGTSFDWAFQEESAQGSTADINLGGKLENCGDGGNIPSSTSSLSTEGFNVSATPLDEAATRPIHGISQVRKGTGMLCPVPLENDSLRHGLFSCEYANAEGIGRLGLL